MRLKQYLIFSIFLPLFTLGQVKKPTFFNPTGAYTLHGKTDQKTGDIYGFYGEIKVKSLSNSSIAITLFLSKGAPSYYVEDIWDTLKLVGNTATFISIEDANYNFTFKFKKRSVMVSQIRREVEGGTARSRIITIGNFIKISDEIPVIDDPLKG